jgi:hypothetical protein
MATGWKTVVITPRTNIPPINLCTKLNPLWWCKNLDHPTPPDWYRPGQKMRNLRWNMRNPCNNFTFYTIGIADKTFERRGKYPEVVFNPNGGWSYSVCRYKRLCLPFLSYQHGKFKFYAGWRNRGNIGFKLTFK